MNPEMRLPEIQNTLRQIKETYNKKEVLSAKAKEEIETMVENLSKELLELKIEIVVDSYLVRQVVSLLEELDSLRNDLQNLRES